MAEETLLHSRPDREIYKTTIVPGDFNIVPYEDSRCRITLTDVKCTNGVGECQIDEQSRIFSRNFDGSVLIGDNDCYLDRGFEVILQRMCCGETCDGRIVYKDSSGCLVKEISCRVNLLEVTEEQVISDWSWQRLHEAAVHHKDRGVALVKEKRIKEAFNRFSRAFKFLVAIEPVDPEEVTEDRVEELLDLKIKLYNNLAYCQLQYKENDAVVELCTRALKYDPDNVKALYRRGTAYTELKLYEEAWSDIQNVLRLDPSDKAAQQKAAEIKPMIKEINRNYASVIRKMFQ